jgi:hypothetical protein
MKLTEEAKQKMDAMNYRTMLYHWRFDPPGSPTFQGEYGAYFARTMFAKRDADPTGAVADSKAIGWVAIGGD